MLKKILPPPLSTDIVVDNAEHVTLSSVSLDELKAKQQQYKEHKQAYDDDGEEEHDFHGGPQASCRQQ